MKKIFLAACVTVLFFACRKQENDNTDICTDAVVRWGGAPEADGLGWYLHADSSNVSYIPQNLPAEFKVDNLPVTVCLRVTDEKFYCMCAQTVLKYHIDHIHRR